MRLEHSLVLARYLHALFGADSLEALQADLVPAEEGPRGDGSSYFLGRLGSRRGLQLDPDLLAAYDRRVMGYEARLRRAGRDVRFRYFQFLALLYAEVTLDRLTSAPDAFLDSLNGFLDGLRHEGAHLAGFPAFTPDDLRRLAFFAATGSGKTLLLHVNLWQVRHYLDEGAHPEALVRPLDGRAGARAGFDHVLLVTPGEGLSAQHLREFAQSGIAAVRLGDALRSPARHVGHVKVTEISKLADAVTGDGVSVEVGSLGGANLVFVDEGHKGTGSEAQIWKDRQKRLSARGLLIEYSATFAQAIAAASRAKAVDLRHAYGKAILFDYSYRYFYGDGFGKDFAVANVASREEEIADPDDLLVAGLLLFYQQHRLFGRHRDEAAHVYGLAAPLWVFVGSSVNAVYSRQGQRRSDVATVLAFLSRFLADEAWAVETIRRHLMGASALLDAAAQGLFSHLQGSDPARLYDAITRDVLGGRGALEVWEVKQADGEFGLRVSGADGETPYFGVVSIGDGAAFKKHLLEHAGLEAKEDALSPSLFASIDAPGSSVQVLVGARRFAEGWSSWRVSTMGLLNVGKGEGSQVIQLFGRGVRLRGRGLSLKRSHETPGAPAWLEPLETLSVLGWNADYVARFREMLEAEGLAHEATVPTRRLDPFPTGLYIPALPDDYDASAEAVTLEPVAGLSVTVDRSPRATVAVSQGRGLVAAKAAGRGVRVPFEDETQPFAAALDWTALHRDLLDHARTKGYSTLHVSAEGLPTLLGESCAVLLPDAARADPGHLQRGARDALRLYVDKFVQHRAREAENGHLAPREVQADEDPIRSLLVTEYRLQAAEKALLDRVLGLVADGSFWAGGEEPLPRLHFDRHLYNPLPRKHADLGIRPAPLNDGETRTVEDLREFWRDHHDEAGYKGVELFLLRNLPRIGVGFYRSGGFYPDFLLWVRYPDGAQRVVFLEPHGMLHETEGVHAPKLQALLDLRRLNADARFRAARVTLDGYILTETPADRIAGATGHTADDLRREHALVLLDADGDRRIGRERWVPHAVPRAPGGTVGG